MAGSISTLGVGSGLQLQDILDKLRAVDQQVIDRKKSEVSTVKAQLEEFTTVKNKLLTMKSAALNLSLSSTFLGRSVSSSSESTLTATVVDGATVKNSEVKVTNLAQKSSWMATSGVSSLDSIVYVPTSQISSGVTNPATAGALGNGNLTITFGGSSAITVAVDASTMLDDGNASGLSLVSKINNAPANAGKVLASTYTSSGKTYLKIETATAGGAGESNRVAITANGTNLTFAPPNKSLTLQIGSKESSLSVAPETTLSQLVSMINSASDNPGLTASTVNDGIDPNKPYKLVLMANGYGEDNRIEITEALPDLPMVEPDSQTALHSLNAQFTIDGITYQRQSNTVSDVLSGVTMTMKGIGTSTIAVSNNDEDLKSKITTLVTAYNDVVQEVQKNNGYDQENGTWGSLAGTTIRDLPFDLQGLMTGNSAADPERQITSLFSLGLEFDRDGTITINNDTLSAAISDHRDGVQAFFLGDSLNNIEGLADKVNSRLRTMTTDKGLVEGEKTTAQSRIDDLNLQISEANGRLDRKYTLLNQQFVALDTFMNQMTSMSNFLKGQFNSLSSGWSGTGSNANS